MTMHEAIKSQLGSVGAQCGSCSQTGVKVWLQYSGNVQPQTTPLLMHSPEKQEPTPPRQISGSSKSGGTRQNPPSLPGPATQIPDWQVPNCDLHGVELLVFRSIPERGSEAVLHPFPSFLGVYWQVLSTQTASAQGEDTQPPVRLSRTIVEQVGSRGGQPHLPLTHVDRRQPPA